MCTHRSQYLFISSFLSPFTAVNLNAIHQSQHHDANTLIIRICHLRVDQLSVFFFSLPLAHMTGHPAQRKRIVQFVVAFVLVSLLLIGLVTLLRTTPQMPTPYPILEPPLPPSSDSFLNGGARAAFRASPRSLYTFLFRSPEDEVDCDLVLQSVATLYNESKARQAAWSAAGRPHTVVAPKGKDVSEIHILMVGDSWGLRSTLAVARHIDACRLRLPAPLIERDECTVHHVVEGVGHAVYQLSKSALGLAPASTHEDAGLLRIHVHLHWKEYLVDVAPYLESVLGSATPTPSISVSPFPRLAQCRRSVRESVAQMQGKLPLCLCEDTLLLEGAGQRRVPVDAVQVLVGMADTQTPVNTFDLFDFTDTRVDWYQSQSRFSPNLHVYPYISWEDNLQRFRHLLADTYVASVRETVARASVPPGVPMPRVLLSYIPRANCRAPKFKFARVPTLNSTQRCEELAWSLHDLVNEAVVTAHGTPALDFPAVDPPEWLRLVDYRPLAYSESAQYHDPTAKPSPLKGICHLSDGVHFDTFITVSDVHFSNRWCARNAHGLFWSNLRQ